MKNKTEILRGSKMSKMFSIMAKIDLHKIDKEINEYQVLHQFDDDPYIFMNEDTIKAIECELGLDDIVIDNDTWSNKIKNTKGVYATYSGCKVFINNDLKFGIVEIR